MALKPVTDPALLKQLGKPVTDPALLAQLNGEPQQPQLGQLAMLGNQAGRIVAKGVAAPPLLAMDLGVGLRNIGSSIASQIPGATNLVNKARGAIGLAPVENGEQYQLPSEMFNQALDQFTVKPTDLPGKAGEIIGPGIIGAAMGNPQVGNVPANFAKGATLLKNQALSAAQKAGYVIPPSANNPSVANRILEGLAGKTKINQEAAMRNMATTAELANKGVGQSAQSVLTQGALSQIRGEAHAAGYEPVRSFGEILTDKKYLDALDAPLKAAQGAARSFPGLKPPEDLKSVIEPLKQAKFDASDGIDAISYLRQLADDAYSNGNNALGKAYKSVSKAVEDMIERGLEKGGKDGEQLLAGYRAARELMAKTYTAAKGLRGEAGASDATKYALQLAKGKPLTGEQRTIADFAANFPKSARFVDDIHPAISPLDTYGSVIAAGATESMAPLALPLTRLGLREYLLSPSGQARSILQTAAQKQRLGLLGAFPPIYQESGLAQ